VSRGRSDLQLEGDPSARILPWVIGIMVYLAALALGGALSINGAIERWNRALTDRATIQIDPAPSAEQDRRLGLAIEVIKTTPGIARHEVLGRPALIGLLEPWLGRGNLPGELPLPILIDLTIDPAAPPRLDELRRRIEASVPGARLDDHSLWTGGLVAAARAIQALALAAVGLIGLAAVAIVVFATRAGFAAHLEVIDIIHLMGARDAYIARQFQDHFLGLGAKGGILGLAVALATLVGFVVLGESMEGPLLPRLALDWWAWLTLTLLPVLAALVARTTARATVLSQLRRMP